MPLPVFVAGYKRPAGRTRAPVVDRDYHTPATRPFPGAGKQVSHASYDRRFLSISKTENIPSANTFGWLVRSQVSRRSAHDNGMVSSGRAPNFTRISVAWSLISVICLVSSGRGCAGKSARPRGSAAGLICFYTG